MSVAAGSGSAWGRDDVEAILGAAQAIPSKRGGAVNAQVPGFPQDQTRRAPMPAQRMSMRKTREILRLRWGEKRSIREVGRSCRVSASTVVDCTGRAETAGLSWPLPEEMDDAALEAQLYPPKVGSTERPLPDHKVLYRELRKKGVTLELLWMEYRESAGEHGYCYSHFCDLYRSWRKKLDVSMRQEHRAGEKMFVDFTGHTMPLVHRLTGEVSYAEVFVAALGASSYTYAEATESQQSTCWLDAHVHTLEYFEGSAEIWVPDNLKSGVTKPCLYEPEINRSYRDLADHYDAVVIPARKRKPKDKAKVENAVQQVERWVLAPLRNQTFFELHGLNDAIRERLKWLNERPFSQLEGSRRSLYLELDKPALTELPGRRWEPVEWKIDVGVNIDYHFEFDRHFYSVPYHLTQERVDVRATSLVVEALYKNNRVASHPRSMRKGGFTTDPSHRPKAHQKHAEWTPSRLIHWAKTVGPHTAGLVDEILRTRRHPEQGYRSCLGIMRLAKQCSTERMERACERALHIGAVSYKSVASILRTGLDRAPLPDEAPPPSSTPIEHENVRGPEYYQ